MTPSVPLVWSVETNFYWDCMRKNNKSCLPITLRYDFIQYSIRGLFYILDELKKPATRCKILYQSSFSIMLWNISLLKRCFGNVSIETWTLLSNQFTFLYLVYEVMLSRLGKVKRLIKLFFTVTVIWWLDLMMRAGAGLCLMKYLTESQINFHGRSHARAVPPAEFKSYSCCEPFERILNTLRPVDCSPLSPPTTLLLSWELNH